MARRASRTAALIIAALLALAAPAAGQERPTLPDIEDEVMCVECGTALNISQSRVADRQRELIRRLIDDGLTKQQIKERLVAEFGPGVLAAPPERGFNLAVYLVPPLLAGLALAAILTTARRWRRAGRDEDDEPPAALGDDDARRLDRDMAGYDL